LKKVVTKNPAILQMSGNFIGRFTSTIYRKMKTYRKLVIINNLQPQQY
jgi:hypothetical protein